MGEFTILKESKLKLHCELLRQTSLDSLGKGQFKTALATALSVSVSAELPINEVLPAEMGGGFT